MTVTRTVRSRSVGGLLWSSAGVATQALGQFAVLAVLARLLTPSDFGVVTASLVIIGFARMSTTEGIVGPAVTQRAVLSEQHIRAAVMLSLITGVLTAGIVWVMAPPLADFFQKPSLTEVTRALAAILLLQSLSSVPQALLLRGLEFRRVAITDIVSFLFGFAGVGIWLAVSGAGVWALVGAYVSQAFLQAVMLLVMRPLAAPWRWGWPQVRDLLVFGSGHTLARYLNYCALQGDFIVVGRYMSSAALGIYGRAYQMATSPAILLGGVIDKVLFPTLAARQADRERLARDFRRAVSLTVSLTAPLAALVVVLAPELVRTVLGSGWNAVTLPFQILVATLTLRTGYKISDALAKATGAVYSRAWRQAVYAAAVVGGALLMQPYGLPAVAGAVAVAIAVNYVVMAALSLRLTGLRWVGFLAAHLPGLLLSLGVGAATIAVAAVARRAALADGVVLLISTTSGVAAGAALAYLAPRRFIGVDLDWLLDQLRLGRGHRRAAADG